VLVVALAGCGDDAEPAKLVRRSIGADGGVISSHDGVLTIVFQPGALTETTSIEIFPSAEPPDAFGPAYRVRPNIPLEVDAEIEYRGGLPADVDAAAIGAIRLADYEDEKGSWRPLPTIMLDVENGSVLALDSELSLYYALLDDADGSSDSSSTDDGESSSSDTGSTEDSGSSTDDSTGPVPLSHAADIQPIWDARCRGPGCHELPRDTKGPSPGGGLLLYEDAYDNIVDVFATGANRRLVVPGDPDGSYIVNKLDGSFDDPDVNGSGVRMPLAMPELPAEELELIRRWIEEGASP
jgi:hypothetical protein